MRKIFFCMDRNCKILKHISPDTLLNMLGTSYNFKCIFLKFPYIVEKLVKMCSVAEALERASKSKLLRCSLGIALSTQIYSRIWKLISRSKFAKRIACDVNIFL